MRTSLEITSFWRFALPFALFIVFLGVLPHALFSLNAGGVHYMNNAWNEDADTLHALQHATIIYRMFSAWVVRGLIGTFGLDGGLIAADAIGPFLSAIVAAGLAFRIGFKTRRSLFMAACLMLFALEFLALCNSMTVGPLTQILPFSSPFYPEWFRMFVPDLYENFFSLYKTPEPQFTLILFFASLYALLRHAQTLHWKYALVLGVFALSFPFIYVSTGIALILCIGLYAVAGLLLTHRPTFVLMLVMVTAAVAYYLHWFLTDKSVVNGDSFVFASHLPIFSVSMLWGVGLLLMYLRHWGQNLYTRAWVRECPPPIMLALVCCIVPLITLNQQLVTGLMVQSRTWEYYTNLTFIALALLLLWPMVETHIAPRVPHFLKRRAPYAATALLIVLVIAQIANFVTYNRANLDNLIVAQLLDEQKKNHPDGLPPVMLQSTSEDVQVALRMNTQDVQFIAGSQQALSHPIARLSAGDVTYLHSQDGREAAFTYFDRLGQSQEEFAQKLDAEGTRGMGAVQVARFFSPMDCWKPLSDYRDANVSGMKAKIPSIIADYGAFLKNPERRTDLGEIWFSTRNAHTMRNDVPWQESILATRTLGLFMPVTVTIYRMTPR